MDFISEEILQAAVQQYSDECIKSAELQEECHQFSEDFEKRMCESIREIFGK